MSLAKEISETNNVHYQHLGALRQVGEVLSRDAVQENVLRDVLDVLEKAMDFQRCTIMLLSPDGTELWVEAVGVESSFSRKKVKYRRGEGVTGQVLNSGKAAIVSRISEASHFKGLIHRRGKGESHDCSFICVPICAREEVVGTLLVDVPFCPMDQLQVHQAFLSVVATLVASHVSARRQAEKEQKVLKEENRNLRQELEGVYRPENIIGNSRAIRSVYLKISQVAPSATTVLVRGESGTGKELVATAIHYSSPRKSKPFVRLNCAALNEQLLESELFGHEKGAFTGAVQSRIGRIEQAEGGTLFLDEIGDFSPAVQVKLLRVLQEREYERVGSNQTRKADVRIIAATNLDLEKEVEAGNFRHDLFYRINVFPLFLPPLRERREDILLLSEFFTARYSERMGKKVHRISTTAINLMLAYHWPGNVRELENCVEHAVLLSRDGVIHGSSLPTTLQMPQLLSEREVGPLRLQVDGLERDLIVDALKFHCGSVAAAARDLGITERMVRYKMKNLGIDNKRFSS
ncbi:MAG: sigma 54-interacting transcriptional regulator [Deltaproteobacteria bacterium]|nr:sigma 54-interacting transcriptional regulator [Deltaproteobacteria bacterium]